MYIYRLHPSTTKIVSTLSGFCTIQSKLHSSPNSTDFRDRPWGGAQNLGKGALFWSSILWSLLPCHSLLSNIFDISLLSMCSLLAYWTMVPTKSLTCLYKKRSPVISTQKVLHRAEESLLRVISFIETSKSVQTVSCTFPLSEPRNAPRNATKSWVPHNISAHSFARSRSNSVQWGICHVFLDFVNQFFLKVVMSWPMHQISFLKYTWNLPATNRIVDLSNRERISISFSLWVQWWVKRSHRRVYCWWHRWCIMNSDVGRKHLI